jgi:hypothetical protein
VNFESRALTLYFVCVCVCVRVCVQEAAQYVYCVVDGAVALYFPEVREEGGGDYQQYLQRQKQSCTGAAGAGVGPGGGGAGFGTSSSGSSGGGGNAGAGAASHQLLTPLDSAKRAVGLPTAGEAWACMAAGAAARFKLEAKSTSRAPTSTAEAEASGRPPCPELYRLYWLPLLLLNCSGCTGCLCCF